MSKKNKLKFVETFDLSPEEQLRMLSIFEQKVNSSEADYRSEEEYSNIDGDPFDQLVASAVGAKLSEESQKEECSETKEVIEEVEVTDVAEEYENVQSAIRIFTSWDEENKAFFISGIHGDGVSIYLDSLKPFINDINNEYTLIENITNEVFDRLILSLIPEAVISEKFFNENIVDAISELDESFKFFRKQINGVNYILCYEADEDVISDFGNMIDHFSSLQKVFPLLSEISSITKNKRITFGLQDNIIMKINSDEEARNDFINKIYNNESTVYVDNNVKSSHIEIKNIDDTLYKYDEVLTRLSSRFNGEEKESESAQKADED